MSVNKERVELLCQALESGTFRQGSGCLRNGDKYCCLGVACGVSGLGEWKEVIENDGVFEYLGGHSFLPNRVIEWYGFNSHNPGIKLRWDDSCTMSQANDVYDLSFAEIAVALRRTYLGTEN